MFHTPKLMPHSPKLALLTAAALAALCFGCHSTPPGMAAPSRSLPSRSLPSRSLSATSVPADQSGDPILPDPKMTPGATLPVASGDVCVSGYSKKVRNVPSSVKKQVYAEYGITSHKPGEYEVDHLISLELGGSNSIKNLWPESYLTRPWNAHVKDKLENELHDEVCSGKIDLATAQHEIATDWIASYKKHFHTTGPLTQGGRTRGGRIRSGRMPHPLTDDDPPLSDNSPIAPAKAGASAASGTSPAAGQVWVNLKSGKYFQPGARYYGHTKSGKYLSEADAEKQGYVAAQGQ